MSTPILGNKTQRANAILLMPDVLIILTNEKFVFVLLVLRLSLMYPQLALNLSYSWGWSWISSPHDSTIWELGFQAHSSTSGLCDARNWTPGFQILGIIGKYSSQVNYILCPWRQCFSACSMTHALQQVEISFHEKVGTSLIVIRGHQTFGVVVASADLCVSLR